MASGDAVIKKYETRPQSMDVKALDGVTAPGNGVWFEAEEYSKGSLHIWASLGTFSATLKLMGSNADAKPDDSVDGPQIGSDITAAGITNITTPCKYYKVKPTGVTTCTIQARFHFIRE